ncbi:hypothetical protein LADH09A_004459 [Micromonospora sp. LAH09]|uniref:hypothetical protein n=1 Tax=Micromonospora cabrerizensis TaxID=2911213 RepID=UPI001EE998C0|nr:hypothetical protein [Micromonospora cabrerizensis]MCG5470509.1 hypothetical protein [Micromonospora cabrerizensis]
MNLRKLLLVAVWTIPALAVLSVGAGFLLLRGDAADRRTCQVAVDAAQSTVRTDRWDPPDELPGLGAYPEIHWQGRPLGNPCSLLPGPTDWAYQGVVRLRPEDAQALAEQYDFVPYATLDPDELPDSAAPTDVWPALAPYLPTQPVWRYSASYTAGNQTRVAFLDVEHQTVFFVRWNS